MGHLQFKSQDLPKPVKKQVFLAIVALLFLFILNACGKSNSRQANYSNKEAPFLITGKVNYTKSNTEETEYYNDEDKKKNEETRQPRNIRNIKAEGDYGSDISDNKTIKLTAEVHVEGDTYIPAEFEGQFDREIGKAILTSPQAPYAALVVECRERCAELRVHSVIKDAVVNNKIQSKTEQDTVVSPDYIAALFKLEEDAKKEAQREAQKEDPKNGTQKTEEPAAATQQPDPNAIHETLPQEELRSTRSVELALPARVVADLYQNLTTTRADFAEEFKRNPPTTLETSTQVQTQAQPATSATAGRTQQSKAQQQSQKKQDTTKPAEPKNPTQAPAASAQSTPSATSQQSAPIARSASPAPAPKVDITPEKIQEFLSSLDITGSGIVIDKEDSTARFPLNLGAAYTGSAQRCYAKFPGISKCAKGGSLMAANLFPDSGIGFKRRLNDDIKYSSGLLARVLETLAQDYAESFPESFLEINDLSNRTGGTRVGFSGGSHQNGLEADIIIPSTTPIFSNMNIDEIMKATKYDVLWKMLKTIYDMEYDKNGVATKLLNRIFIDKKHIEKLCNNEDVIKDDPKYHQIFNYLQHWEDHTTHFHLRVDCTAHNECYVMDFNPVPRVSDCERFGVYPERKK